MRDVHRGTMATPSSAATRLTMVCFSSASWTMRACSPAWANSFMVRSWLCGRERRSGTISGCSARSAIVTRFLEASGWRSDTATTAVSCSRNRNSSRLSGFSGGRTSARSSRPEISRGSRRIVLSSVNFTVTSGRRFRKSCKQHRQQSGGRAVDRADADGGGLLAAPGVELDREIVRLRQQMCGRP